MKKSYLLLLSAFILVGCGTTSSEQKDIYDVIVCYPDGTPVNGEVSVEWCTDSTCSKSVVVDENGKASSDLEEDTYTVHIGNLPEGYAYDPNKYVVDKDDKDVTIILSKVANYESGDGTKYITAEELGPYVIKEGVYNVNLTNDIPYLYYAFNPSTPGKYVFESWSLTKDTLLDYYGNNPQLVGDLPVESNDNDGGENNFKYEFEIKGSEYGTQNSGFTMIFGITVNNKNKNAEFPINIECIEQYEFGSDSDGGENQTNNVTNKEQPVLYNAPAESKLVTMPTDGSKPIYYNEEDKLYHVGSANGELLLVHLTTINDLVIDSFSTIQSQNPTALIFDNDNYNSFIDEYKKSANEDGVCPVNNEIKDFLIKFMKGPVGQFLLGWLEIEYNEDTNWLVYCSYYQSIYEELTADVITIDNSLVYGEIASYYSVTVNSTRNISISYVEDGINEYTLICKNPNIKLVYNNVEYGNELGFNVVVSGDRQSDIELTLKTTDSSLDVAQISIALGNANLTRLTAGTHNINVSSLGEDLVLIADEDATYRLSIAKDSNVILTIDDVEYNTNENDINIELLLSFNDKKVFNIRSITETSNVTLKITKVLNAYVGSNDIMFEELSLINGVELKFVVETQAKYAFTVDSYSAEFFRLNINGTNYNPNNDGFITILDLNIGDIVSLVAKNISFEESYSTLYINEVNSELSLGDTNVKVLVSQINGACALFEAPSDGTYSISTSTYAGTIGGKLVYNDDNTGVAARGSKAELMDITLTAGQKIIIYVGYEQTNWETGITPDEFDVVVSIVKK